MCVRVIMGVVNCRLDYKQFVLWYCSLAQFTVQTAQWMQLVMAVINAICVRVIIVVVYFRLRFKQFVLWNFQYESMFFKLFIMLIFPYLCNKTGQDKLNHVILRKHYSIVGFTIYFIMITYLKTVSYI